MSRLPRRLLVLLAVVLALASAAAIAATGTKPPAAVVAAKQARAHTATHTTPPLVPFIRVLTVGTEGPTVFQLQRALKAAGFRPKKVKATGHYGKGTAHEVANFQRHVHIRPSGRYGLRTHLALQKFYDRQGRARLIHVQTSRRYVAITRALVTVAYHTQQVGGNTLLYSQSAATRSLLPKYPAIPPDTDCSGMVTYWYKSVGLPDPSGWGYSPAGWTGSLALHGIVVSAAHPHIGDLAFFGGGYPFGHVAMVVHLNPTLVMSHGGPGVNLLPLTYRSVSQVRRYF